MTDYNGFEAKVLEKLATIEEHIKNQPCKEHHEILNGNGKTGLKTQVFVLWGLFLGTTAILIPVTVNYIKNL